MGGQRYPHVSTEHLVSAYNCGETLKSLAAATGMNEWSVRKRMTNAGALMRTRGGRKPRGTLGQVWDSYANKSTPDKCWEWTGPRTKLGYGTISVGPFKSTAHRAAVLLQGVQIPVGMEVDHLCFNPCCVNPAHLEVVTPEENKRRRRFKLLTHCRRGHEMTPDNIELERNGTVRRCKICRTIQKKRQRAQERNKS